MVITYNLRIRSLVFIYSCDFILLDYTFFLSLSRQYCATQTPIVTAATRQALNRVGLAQVETRNYYNEVCGVEDPIWTTTPPE